MERWNIDMKKKRQSTNPVLQTTSQNDGDQAYEILRNWLQST